MAGTMAKFLSIYEGLYTISKKLAANVYILWNPTTSKERGQYHAYDFQKYKKQENEERRDKNIEGNVPEELSQKGKREWAQFKRKLQRCRTPVVDMKFWIRIAMSQSNAILTLRRPMRLKKKKISIKHLLRDPDSFQR